MKIQTIYTSYQGEVNKFGIGAPVIFIRTAGCHLRCYKKTMGILCDTPEALSTESGDEMHHIAGILGKVRQLSNEAGGIKLVCLTGGDPLYRDPDSINDLLRVLGLAGFQVSVETSGTLSIANYRHHSHVSWVLDYKSISAGIKPKFQTQDIHLLKPTDYIKFVLNDEVDYNEFFDVVSVLKNQTSATIACGLFWGAKISYDWLIKTLIRDQMLGYVVINAQVHKMFTLYDHCVANENFDLSTISIPQKI